MFSVLTKAGRATARLIARFVRVPAEVHRRRVVVGLLIGLSIEGWVDVRTRAMIDPNRPGLHMTDLTVYTEAGGAFFDGRDPYLVTNSRGWRYLYPPLFAMLVAPLHRFAPQQQAVIWFALNMLIAWGCYAETLRLARAAAQKPGERNTPALPAWIGIAALLAISLPALNCLQRGQVGLLKLYLLLVGVRLAMDSPRQIGQCLGGIALAGSIVLKVTPVVPVAYLLIERLAAAVGRNARSRQERAAPLWLGTAAGAVLWTLLVPSLLVGWRANAHHLHTWCNRVAMQAGNVADDPFAGNSQSVRNQSLSNSVQLLKTSFQLRTNKGPDVPSVRPAAEATTPSSDSLVTLLRFTALGMVVMLAVAAGRTSDPLLTLSGFGLACVASLIVSPVSRVHYYVLLLPAMIFVPLWLQRRSMRPAARAAAAAPLILCLAHYSWLSGAGGIGLLGLGTTAWFFAVTATLLCVTLKESAAAANDGPSFITYWRCSAADGRAIALSIVTIAAESRH